MAMTQTHHRSEIGSGTRRFGTMDWIAMLLLIVGGINWGLVGLAQFDLVAAVFGGQDAALSRVVYVLVGLAALYSVYTAVKVNSRDAR